MIVAIHQPNYLPWMGVFEKAFAADTLIILDHVQHVRQSLTRRTKIRAEAGSTDAALLSIPLHKHDRFAPINELRIQGTGWITDHRNKLLAVYRRAPFFDETDDVLCKLVDKVKDGAFLADLNFELMQAICRYIGLTAQFRLSSRMDPQTSGSELMAELTEKEGGASYYSGGGATEYTDENDFGRRGLTFSYQRFFEYAQAVPYEQHQGPYLPGLSILDALFNIGPGETRRYIERYKAWLRSAPVDLDHEPDWPNLRAVNS
jgi:hypothetical protein